ncbi:MAG: DUF2059 domain-containing protein [Hyphomicrobiales bacterium]
MANRHFRRVIGGLCLIGALVACEASQGQAQQAPAAPAQPAAPAAPLPPLPASHLALAREVLAASGVLRGFDPLAANIAMQLLQAYTQKRPANFKDFEEILLAMKPDLDARKGEIIAKAADIYARNLDEASLKAVLAFLQSPVGLKYTATLPVVLDQISAATEDWTKELATFMGQRVVDEMKKRGVDLGR